MTASQDGDWEGLARRWREPEARPDAAWVHTLVDRHSRGLRWVAAIEILVTVAGLTFAVAVILSERTAAAIGLGLAAILHTVLVAGFSFWNRHGVWSPLSQSTGDYLRLAQERCRRQRRSARFLAGLMVVEAAGVTAWILGADVELPSSGWRLGLVVLFGGVIGWSIGQDWAARRRLTQLAGIEAGLAAGH